MKQIKQLQQQIEKNNKSIDEYEQILIYLDMVYHMEQDIKILDDIWDAKQKVWTLETENEINEKYIKIIIDNIDTLPQCLYDTITG